MTISKLVKDFLSREEVQDLIAASDFEEVYKLSYKEFLGANYLPSLLGAGADATSELTSLFYNSGINPLLYMKRIPDYFLCADPIRNFIIPNNIKSIGRYAFASCERLMSITIGSGVEEIEEGAFRGCGRLVAIRNLSKLPLVAGSREYGEVAENAKNIYTVFGGSQLTHTQEGYNFLYDGKKGYLLGRMGFPKVQTTISNPYDLPQSFTAYDGTTIDRYEIWPKAFHGNRNIITLNIPDSVTAIHNFAFEHCTNLENLMIGKNVQSIGVHSFGNTPKLKEVTYGGTMAQWKKLTVKPGVAWAILSNCEVTCADGRLYFKDNGNFGGEWHRY